MIEKDSKVNEAMEIGDIIIVALKEEIKNPRLIGEIRDSEEIDSVMKAMEYSSGHSVVTTIMCANPSETVKRLIENFK